MSIAINLPFRRTQIFALSAALLLLAASCSGSDSSSSALPTSTTSAAETATSTAEPESPSQPSTASTAPSTASSASESQPSIATSIAVGYSLSCAISEDKKVFCWGSNEDSKLGTGLSETDLRYSAVPLEVVGIADAMAVAVGVFHTCVLHQSGAVSCWGYNGGGQAGQLGIDQYGSDIVIPEKVPSMTDAVAVAAGGSHTCALHQTGTVSCWGNNWHGQLGKSQTLNDIDDPTELVQVSNINDATAIAAGQYHTCALHQNGTISCWGLNSDGQLGNGQIIENSGYTSTASPVLVVDITDAIAIAAGYSHSCALRLDGTISCWGSNEDGQLGNGTTDRSSAPMQVIDITDATAITAGGLGGWPGHSCALHDDGIASCWGRNRSGQLGDGTTRDGWSPVHVAGISDATAIATGGDHSCALRLDGAIFCWGYNGDGRLGTGQTSEELRESAVPVRVSDFSDSALPTTSAPEPEPAVPPSPASSAAESQPSIATSIAASYSHSCAVSGDKKVFCWGSNEDSKLGTGLSETDLRYSAVPLEVVGIADAAAVATGENHTCALHESGTVSCWGSDSNNQIGVPDSSVSAVPVQIKDIADAVWIAAGEGHTCAVHQDGTISCWGYNYYGRLGNMQAYEDEDFSTPVPVRVDGITDAVAVTANSANTCALHRSGAVSCWGDNTDGQLGSGHTSEELEESAVPVQVADITDAKAIATGEDHSCALRENGTIACWGDNYDGQLGSGQTREEIEESAIPVQVADITDAKAVSVGESSSCALREDGTIACWGTETSGGFLVGLTSFGLLASDQVEAFPIAKPVQITGVTDAMAIATGENHACALHQNGKISCWGYNLWGRLGNGQTGAEESDTPIEVAGISNAKDIVAGLYHTCVLHESGSISCWGNRRSKPGITIASIEIVEIDDISDAIGIATGWDHFCALHETGTISCWGANWSGQLGNGLTPEELEYSLVPVEVEGIADATAVATNVSHSCALRADGTVFCWGSNWEGQLGNGTGGEIGDASSVPVRVHGISDATAIATSWGHSCALHENGTISCWGNNDSGQLGNGTNENSTVPVQVSFINDAKAIALGQDFSCAVRENGTVACWGRNWDGQLGTLRQPDSESLPGVVPAITDAVSITSGFSSSCALREIGTIKCWSIDLYGEPFIDEVKAIAIGGIAYYSEVHYCAVRQNGKAYCWGNNYHGQLGNEAIWSLLPVKVIGFGG